MRLGVVLSPAAGAGRPERHEPMLRAALGERFELAFYYPATLVEMASAVSEILAGGATHLAVGGGDGTINGVVNMLGDRPIVLAPLPLGSGNDFCRGVGLGSLAVALCALLGGATRQVDLLEVNGVRACTVAGLGLVAAAGLQVCHLSRPGSPLRTPLRALGSSAYLAAGGARILFHPDIAADAHVRWRASGGGWQSRAGRFHGAFLAVRRALGAGLQLPLPVEHEDGQFEVVLVHETGRLRLARHLPRLRTGRTVPPDILSIAHATDAEVEWQGGSPLLVDGEDYGHTRQLIARVLPGALTIPHAI